MCFAAVIQLLDKLSAVISSVHDFIEAVTPPEDPGHDEADDGDNATTREPDASVPADDTIQARLSFLSVSVSMECLAARLVDGGGSDVAFASLQVRNLRRCLWLHPWQTCFLCQLP